MEIKFKLLDVLKILKLNNLYFINVKEKIQ